MVSGSVDMVMKRGSWSGEGKPWIPVPRGSQRDESERPYKASADDAVGTLRMIPLKRHKTRRRK